MLFTRARSRRTSCSPRCRRVPRSLCCSRPPARFRAWSCRPPARDLAPWSRADAARRCRWRRETRESVSAAGDNEAAHAKPSPRAHTRPRPSQGRPNTATRVADPEPAPSGKCKWFDVQKGFGFIDVENQEQDLFVHQTDIKAKGFRSLAEGEALEFKVSRDAKTNKLKVVRQHSPAHAARPAAAHPTPPRAPPPQFPPRAPPAGDRGDGPGRRLCRGRSAGAVL